MLATSAQPRAASAKSIPASTLTDEDDVSPSAEMLALHLSNWCCVRLYQRSLCMQT